MVHSPARAVSSRAFAEGFAVWVVVDLPGLAAEADVDVLVPDAPLTRVTPVFVVLHAPRASSVAAATYNVSFLIIIRCLYIRTPNVSKVYSLTIISRKAVAAYAVTAFLCGWNL